MPFTPLQILSPSTRQVLASVLLSGASIVSSVACAQAESAGASAQSDNEPSWSLGIALGAGGRDNPLVSGEQIDINAVPDLSWHGNRFFFDNGDLGFVFQETNNFSFSWIATVSNERTFYNQFSGARSLFDNTFAPSGIDGKGDPTAEPSTDKPVIDSSAPPSGPSPTDVPIANRPSTPTDTRTSLAEARLPPAGNEQRPADRDYALNSGIEFLFIGPLGDIQGQLVTDISSRHNGEEALLTWSKPWYTRKAELSLTLGLEWKSADFVEYYYGVLPTESYPGRDAYNGSAGTNQFIRLSASRRLSKHWSLVAVAEREFLSSAIKNSPIVHRTFTDTWFTGLFYQF